MIEVSNLVKKYGKYKAVNDISFKIEKGHIYGLLGPNGAGKSTTMNIITGYIASTEGTVLIDGNDIVKEPEKARKMIGYLPELPPLYMDMTVYEYLLFVAQLKKVKKKDRVKQVEDVIVKMQLEENVDKLIRNLSKGFRQRVGFAQALIGNPEILILDEPSVGLDPKQIIEMRNLITELGKEHTVILSSHIMQEVSAVCDYILIINKGKLIASGTHEELTALSDKGARVELTVEANEKKLKEIISKYKDIESYEITTEGNISSVVINMKKDAEDIRKDIYNECSSKGICIINLNLREVSLEEVFLEIITKSDEENDDSIKQVDVDDIKVENGIVDEESEVYSGADGEEEEK